MTPVDRLKSIAPDAPSIDALKILAQSGYHQLPVIDASGHLVGFVTREGLMQRLAVSGAHASVKPARAS